MPVKSAECRIEDEEILPSFSAPSTQRVDLLRNQWAAISPIGTGRDWSGQAFTFRMTMPQIFNG